MSTTSDSSASLVRRQLSVIVRHSSSLVAPRSIWLGLFALTIGGLGELLLLQEKGLGFGALLLVLAVLLAGIAWGGLRETSSLYVGFHSALSPQSSALRSRLLGILGALALIGGSILAWLTDPGAIFGLQGVLWLAGMGLLLLSCARWYPRTQRESELGPPWTRTEIALFCGLVALALFTYTAWLNEVPWRFHYDEVNARYEAMRFYRGPAISMFTTTWWGTGLPSLFFPFAAGLMRLAGTDLGGTRLGVAVIGALTVIPLYGLARVGWGRTVAVLASFAWATSAVAINYSRTSEINMTTAFCWTVCFYFLLRGLRSHRPGDFVWSGLAAGISMYTYYGTRLLPFLLLAYIAYLLVLHFHIFRSLVGHFALMLAGFVAGFGPLIAYFIRYPDMWAGRGLAELNVPPIIPTTWSAWVSDWNVLAPLIQRNFLGLSLLRSHDAVYWAPFFLPAEAVLLLLGIGVLLWRWRDPAAFLVVLWGFSIVFVAGTLIASSLVPSFIHWTPAFPAFFLAVALPPALWLRSLQRVSRRAWLAGCCMVAAGMLYLAAANAYTYLVTYPATVPPSYEAAQGRFLASLGPQARALFVGNSWYPYHQDISEVMAPNVPASDFLNPSRELPVPGDPSHDLVFVFYDDQTEYLPLVQSYYPGGSVRPLEAPGGFSTATAYHVPAAQAASRYGVMLTLTSPTSDTWQGQVPAVGVLPPGISVRYPLTATWSGAFFTPGAEPIRLHLQGAANAIAYMQGEPVALDVLLSLDAGWVPFSVQSYLTGTMPISLLLQQSNGPTVEIATSHLWPQPPNAGLAVALSGPTTAHRIDPFVGSSVLAAANSPIAPTVLRPPYVRDPDLVPLAPLAGGGKQIRWEGELYAEGGQYTMELRTDAHALLLLYGAVALDLCRNAPTPGDFPLRRGYKGLTNTLSLSRGWHHVQLDLDATGRDNGLEWTWTRPDGLREIIPPSRLRHAPASWPSPPTAITCLPR